jgi:succinoglycan biosynthesis transport protein ExoP
VDLHDYVRVLRKRWRLIAICLLAAIGAAAAFSWTATPRYEAKTQLFVAANDTSGGLSNLAQGGQFTQQRVQSYADIVNSPEVTDAIADRLQVGLSGKDIAREISASAPLNTVLVNVSVRDRYPARAQAIANAVSDEFATFASELETTPGTSTSPVKVTVVKRAELPTAPVSPRKTLNLVLGFLLGLAVGIGAAVLRETLDTSVKDPEQVQREYGVPTLGAISYDPDAPKRPLIVQADPHSPRAEAFRQLRTNLQFVNIDEAPRSIVVTSSVPNEGKTTTATNLAIVLAQSGLRVIIVEADLRRPRIAQYLSIEGAVGLTSVLINRAELSDAVQQWGEGGLLSVLPSGPTPPNPSELLGSQGMADLLHELESTYDLVLIDAPPLLPVTDAAVLANAASGALVVVRHGHTRREQLARAIESLRAVDTAVFGVVLTMTPTRGPDAYYYGYGYRYDRPGRRGGSELVMPISRQSRQQRRADAAAATAAEPDPSPLSASTPYESLPPIDETALPGGPNGYGSGQSASTVQGHPPTGP